MDIEYVGSYIEGINQSVIRVYRIVSYHKREYSEKLENMLMMKRLISLQEYLSAVLLVLAILGVVLESAHICGIPSPVQIRPEYIWSVEEVGVKIGVGKVTVPHLIITQWAEQMANRV